MRKSQSFPQNADTSVEPRLARSAAQAFLELPELEQGLTRKTEHREVVES